MITGIKSKFFPSNGISELLIQWIGCARVIYNAKCDEDSYLRAYARKYLTVGTWPDVDKTYSQFKTDLTPWLNGCPSQILRNSATIWHHTYQRFFKGLGGRPKLKSVSNVPTMATLILEIGKPNLTLNVPNAAIVTMLITMPL